MVGRLVYDGGEFGTGSNRPPDGRQTSEVKASSFSTFPISSDIIQQENPSKDNPNLCLPPLTT